MELDYLFQASHLERLMWGLWATAKIAFISVFFLQFWHSFRRHYDF